MFCVLSSWCLVLVYDMWLWNYQAILIWASTQQNRSSGFLKKRGSNKSLQLHRLSIWNFACGKPRYDTFQKANNKGADQTARMLANHRRQVFSRRGPFKLYVTTEFHPCLSVMQLYGDKEYLPAKGQRLHVCLITSFEKCLQKISISIIILPTRSMLWELSRLSFRCPNKYNVVGLLTNDTPLGFQMYCTKWLFLCLYM